MVVKLVQIGNSKGVRLPKAVLKQAGLEDEVNLRVEGRQIIIEPADNPRAGWDEAFKKAIAKHGKELTEEDRAWMAFPNKFDDEEWTW